MKSIYDNYAVKDHESSNGLVLHSTYSIIHPTIPAITAAWMNAIPGETISTWRL